MKRCNQPNCNNSHKASGLCAKHYMERWYKNTHLIGVPHHMLSDRNGAHVLTVKRQVYRCLYCDLILEDCLTNQCDRGAAAILYPLRIPDTLYLIYDLRQKMRYPGPLH